MRTQRRRCQRLYRQGLVPALTLLWALALALRWSGPVQAQASPPGTVVGWGGNANAAPAELSAVIAIAAGPHHDLALKADGTVVAWGADYYGEGTVPAGVSDVIAIAAGYYHNLVLKRDGSVVAWGSNDAGESTVPSGLRDVIAIAAGYAHNLALKADGTVVAWGYGRAGATTIPSGLSDVSAIAASGYHSLALKRDGTVVAWGCLDATYDRGQCAVPAGVSDVLAIAAGELHTLALKRDGAIVGWGDNFYGQSTAPDGLTDVIAIAAGTSHSLALKRDGTVVIWGDDFFRQLSTKPAGLRHVTAIAANSFHSLALSAPADATPPTANPSLSPAANGAGWNNTDVTVDWNWTDNPEGVGSDPAHCTTSSTSSGEGTITLSATCQDLAGNEGAATYTVKVDKRVPLITGERAPNASPTGWSRSQVAVSFTCADEGPAGVAINTLAGALLSGEGANQSVTNTGQCEDFAGNVAAPVTVSSINIDQTQPTLSAAATTQPNANGWYNSIVTIHFTCTDALSGIARCHDDLSLFGEWKNLTLPGLAIVDLAGNISDFSNAITVKIDKTAPSVIVTGVTAGAAYNLGSVPTAACSTSDALAGVATPATLSVTGGNGDGTGSFTATCSGATDLASNSAASVSVSYTVSAPVDACTTTVLRDDFNRANGSLGSNWAGLTGQSFYKIAGNRVDVQLGGPVLWKPTTYGVNQAAFVTLSTLDPLSPSQGLLLKVQSGTIPTGGAIAVVYDNRAKAVRVSTLRLNTPTWTVYGNTPAVFANGDKLLGCVQANGTVRVYRNNSLLTTVTLSAADQSFFNTKGGRIGLWTVAAPNAFLDDFGGGALTDVISATLDTTVPDEVADDGDEITVAENFPTDVAAPATPDADALVNRAFLPLVNQ